MAAGIGEGVAKGGKKKEETRRKWATADKNGARTRRSGADASRLGSARIRCIFNRGSGFPDVTAAPRRKTVRPNSETLKVELPSLCPSLPPRKPCKLSEAAGQGTANFLAGVETMPHIILLPPDKKIKKNRKFVSSNLTRLASRALVETIIM